MPGDRLIASKVNFSQNDKELIRNIYRKTDELVYLINTKDTAIYDYEEIFTSQQWYAGQEQNEQKMIYRKVIDFGALPAAGTKSVAHNLNKDITGATIPINANWDFIKIRLKAFDPASVTWFANLGHFCSVSVSALNVLVQVQTNLSAFTQSEVILEYTKQ